MGVPLESSDSNVQIDAAVRQVPDVWAGSSIDQIVQHYSIEGNSDNMLDAIQNLFVAISNQKKQVGVIGPRQFITKLKQENGTFC